MKYGYTTERFFAARDAWAVASPDTEHLSVVSALRECRLGLHRMNRSKLDDDARALIYKLERYTDTAGFYDAGEESALTIKAKGMTPGEKTEIAALVDGLAKWFASHGD